MKNIIKALRNKRTIYLKNATENLINDQIEEGKSDINKMEVIDKIINEYSTKTKKIIISFIVFILAFIIVCTLESKKVKSTDISFSILTESLQLNTDTIKNVDFLFNTKYFKIYGLKQIRFQDQDYKNGIVYIGDQYYFTVSKLNSKGPTNMTFLSVNKNTNITLFGITEIKGNSSVLKKGKLNGKFIHFNTNYTNFLQFNEDSISNKVISICFEQDSIPIDLAKFNIKSISFNGKVENDNIKSKIISGKIKILLNNQEINLEPCDNFEVSLSEIKSFKQKINSGFLQIDFSGKVNKLEVNSINYLPSLLLFLYFSSNITIFWTSLIFIIGIFWKINQIF
jgi:hypothetical protein